MSIQDELREAASDFRMGEWGLMFKAADHIDQLEKELIEARKDAVFSTKEPTLKDKLKAIDAWISAAKYGLSEPEHLDKVSATLGVAQRILREVIRETKN